MATSETSEFPRRSPYQGLIPYSETDAPFFFGREKDTRLITASLFATSLTLLYGASGVGKSSVLRAGVSYHLQQDDDLLVVVFNSWQGSPLDELKAAVVNAARRVRSTGLSLSESAPLDEYLAALAKQLGRRLMIILDQFEEYFLYHLQNTAFDEEFPQAILQGEVPVNFLISIREDALAKLDRFEGSIPALFDSYLRIEHLSREAAREAIVEPINKYNSLNMSDAAQIRMEPELVKAVLEQLQSGQVTLAEGGRGTVKHEAIAKTQIETPYLQMVMTRLWEEEVRSGSKVLQLETLKRLGGAERIVETHLDSTMSVLSPDERSIAAGIFHYLVTPSRTKIAYTVSDLAASAELDKEKVVGVVEKLKGVRILRSVNPLFKKQGELRCEIFHDVMAAPILAWQTEYKHVESRRQAEERQRQAEKRARVEEKAKQAGRLSLLVAALAIMTVLAMAVAVYAFTQGNKARDAQLEALAAQREAVGQRDLAKVQRDEAENQRIKAKDAEKKAADALIEADKQRVFAEVQKGKAEEAQRSAIKERNAAKAAEKKAADALIEVDKQRVLAEVQRDKAENERIKAEDAQRKADEQKAEALKQRDELKIAQQREAEARQEAEAQRIRVAANEAFFRQLSVRTTDTLLELQVALKTERRDVATHILQNIVADIIRNPVIKVSLKEANVSPLTTDGENLMTTLLDIRRKLVKANDIELLDKINQAIFVNAVLRLGRHAVSYVADDSGYLKDLELSFERDERSLGSKIVSFQLVNIFGGKKTTRAVYEDTYSTKLGHLILTTYTTEADEQSQRAMHSAEGETFVVKGEAYIKGQAVKVLVFREKQ